MTEGGKKEGREGRNEGGREGGKSGEMKGDLRIKDIYMYMYITSLRVESKDTHCTRACTCAFF